MSKILVTGGAGFIGSRIIDLFIAQGQEIIIIDNLSTSHASILNPSAMWNVSRSRRW